MNRVLMTDEPWDGVIIMARKVYQYMCKNYNRQGILPQTIWDPIFDNLVQYDKYKLPVLPPLVEEGLKPEEYAYTDFSRLAMRGDNDLFAPPPRRILGKTKKKLTVIYNNQLHKLEKSKNFVSERLFGLRVSEGTFIKEKEIIKSYNLKKAQIFSTQMGAEDLTEALSDYEKMIKAKFNPQKNLRYAPGLRKLSFSEIGIPLITRRSLPKRDLVCRESALSNQDVALSRIKGNYIRYSDRYKKEVNVNFEQKELYAVYLKNGYLEKQGSGLTGYNMQQIKIEPIEQLIRAVAEENSFSNLIVVPIFLMILIFSRFIVVESITFVYKKVKEKVKKKI